MKWEKCREIMEKNAIKIDDMATEDAYFLATHMPFSKLEVYEGGRTSSTPKLLSEDEIFEQLVYNPDNQHRMIIVRGNNGTGKSHLIRYLKAKLESSPATIFNPEKEQLVFLRRLNNSVRGAFSQLLEQKVIRDPAVEERLRKFVESTESKDEATFKNEILYAYVSAVRSDQSNKPYRSVICRDIASYLSDSRVAEFLLREGGPISKCYQIITSSSSTVLKETVVFTEEDFNDRKIIRAVKKQGDPQASDFATTLSEGDDEVRKLVDYLNRFTRNVVQRCAGVSSESTKTVFEELRKKLKKQGKNLTLFIEDFTGFTGVDSEMITVLSTEHGGDYDYLCRVTALIGITDGYYDQFKDNFKDRVTHQISVTERSFGDPEFLTQMTGRYLNAIYTEPERIRKWYQDGANFSMLPLSGFKPDFEWDATDIAGKPVSLYPFNKRAILGLYEHLPVKSPRMFLRDVLRAQLKEYFDGKTYGDQWDFPRNDAHIQMSNPVHSSNIDRNEQLSKEERERVKAILALWGDGSATGVKKQDSVFFGGVNQLFFRDVALPFNGIGDIIDVNKGYSEEQQPQDPNINEKEETEKKKHKNSSELRYDRELEDINRWYSSGDSLQYHPDYRKYIMEFLCGTANQVGAIPWQDIGVPAYVAYERLNDLSAISIEGQASGYNANSIVVLDRSVECRDALIALCTENYAGGWDFDTSIYYQQQLIDWLERNKEQIIRRVLALQEDELGPQITAWGLALQYIRKLSAGNTIEMASEVEALRDLSTQEITEKMIEYRTKEWEDFNSFIKSRKSEFDLNVSLLNKSARTTMGAIAGARDEDKKKAFYRSAELFSAYQELSDAEWDIVRELPKKPASISLYKPAKLLLELYPRIQIVVEAETRDYDSILQQIESYIGALSKEALIDVFNSFQGLFTTFSMNGLPGYKELRDKYEHASPLDEAKRILKAYHELSNLETKTLMGKFAILSGEHKSILKKFLVDLKNIDLAVTKEEKNAKDEIKKSAIPDGLEEVVEAAKENLGHLYDRLSEMEVRNDN